VGSKKRFMCRRSNLDVMVGAKSWGTEQFTAPTPSRSVSSKRWTGAVTVPVIGTM
jgi:hypothetical protein